MAEVKLIIFTKSWKPQHVLISRVIQVMFLGLLPLKKDCDVKAFVIGGRVGGEKYLIFYFQGDTNNLDQGKVSEAGSWYLEGDLAPMNFCNGFFSAKRSKVTCLPREG